MCLGHNARLSSKNKQVNMILIVNEVNVYKINCILFVVDSQFYESWAFMRDQERSSMMPMMAAGEFLLRRR